MTTWRLWRALKSPPAANPIFRRVTTAYHEDFYWPILVQNIVLQGQIWFWSLLFVVDTRALILMAFSGTCYGAIWAITISGTIAGQRTYGMYDLLCLSPTGTVGVNWAICTGCLHRHQAFASVNSQEAWSVRLILFIPLVVSANVLFGRIFSATGTITIVWLFAFLTLFYIDHVQSIILGSLFGVLAPQRNTNGLDTRIWAIAGFLLVQVFTYLILIVSVLFILPGLFDRVGFGGLLADLSLPLLSILIFYAVREVVIMRLWHILTWDLNAAPAELDSMFQRAPSPDWITA
jgi:hypothetical protein